MPPHEFDLNAYLTRIGLGEHGRLQDYGPPSLSRLRAVISNHAATIPFENLDIILGRPIQLDIGSIQSKLVDAKRGGYCFEQNTLLKAALEGLGFTVTSLMARVNRGVAADVITSLTHMLLRVDLPEGSFLADVGFGNLTPTAPLKFDCIDRQPTEHEDFRLCPIENELLLQVSIQNEWDNVYRFANSASYPIDHEVANWFTSTKPDDIFTANVIAARPGTNSRRTFFNGMVTVRDLDGTTERSEIETDSALDDTLRESFGIVLNAAEVSKVQSAIRSFTARPDTGFRLE